MQSIYKGVLMVSVFSSIEYLSFSKHKNKVAGSRFAWTTRNVHITALNDSKYVGMSLYNVVLLSTTAAVVGYFLRDQHERSYILTSFFILLCVTITLCLVFVPKVLEVAKDPRSRAKPQRPVATIKKRSVPVLDSYRQNRQQMTSRIKYLTNQNEILRLNALKVRRSFSTSTNDDIRFF